MPDQIHTRDVQRVEHTADVFDQRVGVIAGRRFVGSALSTPAEPNDMKTIAESRRERVEAMHVVAESREK
jgi:hypothetical protein